MPRSTHPRIAALSEEDLFAKGCCTMAEYEATESAMTFSGLSASELYAAMNAGILPWLQPGRSRLIPRRALSLYLEILFERDPNPKRKPAPARGAHVRIHQANTV